MEEYYIGLAYSNLQQQYSVPTIVSGVVATKENVEELREKKIPRKDTLIQRVASLSDLQQAFDDTETLLEDFSTVRVSPLHDPAETIGATYLDVTRHFLEGKLLMFIGRIKAISYRKIVATPGFRSTTISKNYEQKLSGFAEFVGAKDDNDPDPLLQCARILARIEYEQLRLHSPRFAIDTINKNLTSCIQLLKTSYKYPPVTDYNDYFVGYPTLAIRRSDGSLSYLQLKPQRKISIKPIARFCLGIRKNRSSVPCIDKDAKVPFGRLIFNSGDEQCLGCRESTKFVECLRRKPLCDGFEVHCGNEEFAGGICSGSFGLYVTRFSRTLKIGNAFLPNLIGRLLDQGANSALLLYPIEGIELAWKLEKTLQEYLANYIKKTSSIEIDSVKRRVSSTKEKLIDFSDEWNRDDYDLLREIRELLESNQISGEEGNFNLSGVEMQIMSFLKNYIKPKSSLALKHYKFMSTYDVINGRIMGYRGTIFFLDSKAIIDFRKLQGFVCGGNLQCQVS